MYAVWYSEQQLDIEFITAIRMFIVRIIREAGGAASPLLVAEQLQQSGVSTVPLSAGDVQQVLDTLLMEGEWWSWCPPRHDAGSNRHAHRLSVPALPCPALPGSLPGSFAAWLAACFTAGWVDYEDAGRTRVAHLHKPEAMDFPSKK